MMRGKNLQYNYVSLRLSPQNSSLVDDLRQLFVTAAGMYAAPIRS